mmetsp:Transcript_13942/g.35998  ORF Transcript_13942/g.35998 Transcript_13942/m.35998 type:complete len:147 (+) Transcript_13942:2749-3189(+)
MAVAMAMDVHISRGLRTASSGCRFRRPIPRLGTCLVTHLGTRDAQWNYCVTGRALHARNYCHRRHSLCHCTLGRILDHYLGRTLDHSPPPRRHTMVVAVDAAACHGWCAGPLCIMRSGHVPARGADVGPRPPPADIDVTMRPSVPR